jgi:hypothetical protein
MLQSQISQRLRLVLIQRISRRRPTRTRASCSLIMWLTYSGVIAWDSSHMTGSSWAMSLAARPAYLDAFNAAGVGTETNALTGQENGATDQTINPSAVEEITSLSAPLRPERASSPSMLTVAVNRRAAAGCALPHGWTHAPVVGARTRAVRPDCRARTRAPTT